MTKARPEVPSAELQELARAYTSDWCVDGCFERAELEAAARLLCAAPVFARLQPPKFENWADASILADAMTRIGRLPAGRAAER
jgi:NitT/TauT family transport system substrate-binding protein